MSSYYETLNVAPTASSAEIETAYDTAYNQWRRLVTHHDPAMVNQANESLRMLEEIRTILLDPQKRASYDTTIGLQGMAGGLTDLQATPPTALPVMSPPRRPAMPIGGEKPQTLQRTDAWVCPKCQTANGVGTRFCKGCGQSLGRDCPNCGKLTETAAPFCSSCGVNMAEAERTKAAVVQATAIETAKLERQIAEQQMALGPMKKIADESANLRTIGCVLFFIPYLNLAAPILWLMTISRANQIENMMTIPGDAEYRNKAKGAKKWATLGLVWLALSIVAVVLFLISS